MEPRKGYVLRLLFTGSFRAVSRAVPILFLLLVFLPTPVLIRSCQTSLHAKHRKLTNYSNFSNHNPKVSTPARLANDPTPLPPFHHLCPSLHCPPHRHPPPPPLLLLPRPHPPIKDRLKTTRVAQNQHMCMFHFLQLLRPLMHLPHYPEALRFNRHRSRLTSSKQAQHQIL